MHGTFVGRASEWRNSYECSIHHVPLIFDPIIGTLIYLVGDPNPRSLPSKVERCPKCYPTVDDLMKFCMKDFNRNWKASSDPSTPKIEKLVVLWKDGKRNEYPISE